MSELWPLDVRNKLERGSVGPLRPFRCLLLMPFEGRFDKVAEAIHSIVLDTFTKLKNFGFDELPHINRLDWVTSSGVIQQEIWHEIFHADLIFCDITGYNANVMFEAGVCAGWKRIEQIVFIRDHFYKGQSPFDMAPLRYTEYELTSDGIPGFRQKVQHLVTQALIAFPDNQGNVEPITLPLHIDFNNGTDDVRIYTPQFAHRRIFNRALEFGSLLQFSHSWASIGKQPFLNISMYFKARFSNPMPGEAWIGVGLRSQHFFANFGHVLYLKKDGRIILVEPNEIPLRSMLTSSSEALFRSIWLQTMNFAFSSMNEILPSRLTNSMWHWMSQRCRRSSGQG